MGDKPVPCPCLEVIQAHLGDVEMDPEVLAAGCFCEQAKLAQLDLPRALAEVAALRALKAPEGDLVEAVDALVAAAVEVERGECSDAARCDEFVKRLVYERDQARAEVERIRGLLRRSAAWVNVVAEMGEIDDEDDVSDLADLRRDIDEALRG